MQLVKRFTLNERGRDFVVGDIHGAFDLVLEAMKVANFDSAVDRLFVPGDLIDRGTGSARCLRFLRQPYVVSARGNHEDMLLQLYANGAEPPQALLNWQAEHNGLGWWLSVSPETRAEILAAIAELPVAIEVETERGLVGIVHAEVPVGLSWQEFTAKLEAGDAATLDAALWGRSRIKANDCSGVPGVGRVFVGHTPHWNGMGNYANVFAVDTGATYREAGAKPYACLTMAQLVAGTQILVAPRANNALIDLRHAGVTDSPFSPIPQRV